MNFSDAYKRIERYQFGNVKANFISKIDIIANKRSSKRKKDQADLDELEQFDEGNV